jgi:hypothetical protein
MMVAPDLFTCNKLIFLQFLCTPAIIFELKTIN